MNRDLLCAVDVGTGSARAGIFASDGHLIARSEHAIAMHRPRPGHAEHDSEDIWRAVCAAVRSARAQAGVAPEAVAAIGFDATCSLVVRDRQGRQLTVSTGGDDRWDTIVWLDHRAIGEADECSATGHRVLDYLGGIMSPEMQTPKLMWLKRNLPQTWAGAGLFFDLADFLTWRACGATGRSQCTLTAKWTYLAHDGGWQPDFFAALGVEDLLERGGLPAGATPVGTALGHLAPAAADELGLHAGCVVATGMIDAFAGALGVIGCIGDDEIERHVALIAGTSNCVMGLSGQARHRSGIWGPYFGVVVPGRWVWEGGQSATGGLLDHIIRMFGDGRKPDAGTHREIIGRIGELRAAEGVDFAADIHVVPDFHGNRSPFADPHAKGTITGLTLDHSFDNLCRVYWRTALGIALGVRQIVDHLNANGGEIETLHIVGGHRSNPLLMELYADATGLGVCEPQTADAVLLGTAMAAAAAGPHGDLATACAAMAPASSIRYPQAEPGRRYARDYEVFKSLQALGRPRSGGR